MLGSSKIDFLQATSKGLLTKFLALRSNLYHTNNNKQISKYKTSVTLLTNSDEYGETGIVKLTRKLSSKKMCCCLVATCGMNINSVVQILLQMMRIV